MRTKAASSLYIGEYRSSDRPSAKLFSCKFYHFNINGRFVNVTKEYSYVYVGAEEQKQLLSRMSVS